MKNKMIKLGAIALAGMLFATNTMTAQAAFDDENSTGTWDWAGEHIAWAEYEEIVAGKANNCFDADGLVTRAEAVTMMVKFKEIDTAQYDITCEQFEDVGEEWYTKFINAAYANGLVSGKTETIFDPEGQLTRAEAAAMIVNTMGYETETEVEVVFTDIDGDWYTGCIKTAYAHEVVAGKSEGVFDPDANVTRAEMVTMIHNTMKENFEVGMLSSIMMYETPGSYIVVNAEGQSVNYDGDRTEEEGGKFIADIEDYNVMQYTPSGYSIDLPLTNSLTYQCNLKETEGIVFCGINSTVTISGTNIDKVQVNEDGTIYLYGTDMEYTVSLENMAHTVEYSATSANDVILKVVDKQFVEVTE